MFKLKVIFIQSKDCNGKINSGKIEIRGAADLVVRRISSILQFTVFEGFKPSFDALSTSDCDSVNCLFEFVEKSFKHEVAIWIKSRLKMLQRFVMDDTVVIPTCVTEEFDELARRLLIGLLYVLRSKIAVPIVVDDMLSFVVNELYGDAFVAMMRPYKFTLNRDLRSDEVLKFNPVVIAPGGHGGFYRLADPHRYVILFDGERWTVPRRDVEKIAYS